MARRPSASGRCAGAHLPAPLMASAEGGGSLPFGTLAISGGETRASPASWPWATARTRAKAVEEKRMETARHGTLGHAARFILFPVRKPERWSMPEKNGFFSGADHRSGSALPTDDSDGPTPERFWKVRRGAPSSAADGQCRRGRIAPLRHATISGGFSAGFARVLAVGHGQDAGEGCRREKNGNCAAWHTRPCRAVVLFPVRKPERWSMPEKNGFFSGADHR